MSRFLSCLSGRCSGGVAATSPVPISLSPSGGGGEGEGEGEGEDLISDLPNEVLAAIMALLPTKEAARTTLLSTRWRGLWAGAPLVLDDSELLLGGNFPGLGKVTATVSHAITAHPGPFHSVNLTCYFAEEEVGTLNDWIRVLSIKGVHNLVLANIPWAGLDVLPRALLRCRALERLHVSAWRFPDTSAVTAVEFPRLRELVLSKSVIREEDLGFMLARCPALSSLVFFLSRGVPARVHLRSPSLRGVVFWQSVADELVAAAPLLERIILSSSSLTGGHCDDHEHHRMRIKIGHASVLQVLGYLNPSSHVLQIGDTVIRPGRTTNPEVQVLSVKILAIAVRLRVVDEARMVPCFLTCFPNTETLHLMSVHDYGVYGPSDKIGNFNFWKEIGSVQCVKSRVRKVVLHGFRWEDHEIEFLTSIIEGGRVLEKVHIYQAHYGCPPDSNIIGRQNLLIASLNWGGSVTISADQNISRYDIATDLTRADPFDCQSI